MKKQITTKDAPGADHILSQAVTSNGFVFVAGQIHNTPDGSMVEGSTKEKVSRIMQNIQAILQAASCDLDDIVRMTVYVTDMAQMAELNEVYPTFFNKQYPAREAVCVKELPLGATIEMSATATLNSQ